MNNRQIPVEEIDPQQYEQFIEWKSGMKRGVNASHISEQEGKADQKERIEQIFGDYNIKTKQVYNQFCELREIFVQDIKAKFNDLYSKLQEVLFDRKLILIEKIQAELKEFPPVILPTKEQDLQKLYDEILDYKCVRKFQREFSSRDDGMEDEIDQIIKDFKINLYKESISIKQTIEAAFLLIQNYNEDSMDNTSPQKDQLKAKNFQEAERLKEKQFTGIQSKTNESYHMVDLETDNLIAIAQEGESVHIFDTLNLRVTQSFKGIKPGYFRCIARLDSSKIAIGTRDPDAIQFYDFNNEELTEENEIKLESGLTGLIKCSDRLITAERDKFLIKSWRKNERGKYLLDKVIGNHDNTVYSLAELDQDMFASGGWDYQVKIWNIKSQDMLVSEFRDFGFVKNIVRMDASQIVTSVYPGELHMWDWQQKYMLKKLDLKFIELENTYSLSETQVLVPYYEKQEKQPHLTQKIYDEYGVEILNSSQSSPNQSTGEIQQKIDRPLVWNIRDNSQIRFGDVKKDELCHSIIQMQQSKEYVALSNKGLIFFK